MKHEHIHLKIATFEQPIYEETVDEFTITTKDGVITVLPDHTPLVSALADGELVVVREGVERGFALFGGVLDIESGSKATILADISEPAEMINVEMAKKAYERAKALLEEKRHEDDVDFAQMSTQLQRELIKLQVGTKWR